MLLIGGRDKCGQGSGNIKKARRLILRATSIIHFHIQFPVAVVMAPVIAVAPIARPNTVNIKPAILFLL